MYIRQVPPAWLSAVSKTTATAMLQALLIRCKHAGIMVCTRPSLQQLTAAQQSLAALALCTGSRVLQCTLHVETLQLVAAPLTTPPCILEDPTKSYRVVAQLTGPINPFKICLVLWMSTEKSMPLSDHNGSCLRRQAELRLTSLCFSVHWVKSKPSRPPLNQ